MTKEHSAVEWIAERFRQYQKEGYKSNWDEVIQTVLLAKEIEDQELAKERERTAKMVSDLDKLAEKYKAEGLYLSWAAIKQITGSYRNNIPPETTWNQTAC